MRKDLREYCCQNSKCAGFRKRDHGNLTITARYGKDKARRMLRCKLCGQRFSETKGTVYYRGKKSPEIIDNILRHLQEATGIRKTERLVHVHRDTVTRYGRLAGEHAFKLHDEFRVLGRFVRKYTLSASFY